MKSFPSQVALISVS